MPTINGQFTVCWTANENANTVEYNITGITPPVSGTINETCTGSIPGQCCVDIPITYDEPSCDTLTINVTIYSDCDPDNTISYVQSFPLNEGCATYLLTCVNEAGCERFNTTSLCPSCTNFNNSTVIDTYSNNPTFDPPILSSFVSNNYIPFESVFVFCYSDLQNIITELGETDWTITPEPLGCCWDCRQYQFLFEPEERAYNGGIRLKPEIFPMIVGTACDKEKACYIPFSFTLTPNAIGNTGEDPFIITICMRENSYTVLGNLYPVTVSDLGPCPTP